MVCCAIRSVKRSSLVYRTSVGVRRVSLPVRAAKVDRRRKASTLVVESNEGWSKVLLTDVVSKVRSRSRSKAEGR